MGISSSIDESSLSGSNTPVIFNLKVIILDIRRAGREMAGGS